MAQRINSQNMDPVAPKDFQIRVHVIECRELQPRDANGMSDPVILVQACKKKKYTAKYKKTTSCVFDHLMFFEFKMMTEKFFTNKVFGNLFAILNLQINITVFDANTLKRNVEIGSYFFDIASIYENPNHEIYRQWVALTDSTGIHSGIQGYLKVSVTVLGPGDSAPAHNELEEEDDDLGEESDLQAMVLLPPTISVEEYSLDFSIYKAENLPKMDTFGKIDAFVAVKFGGNPEITTQSIKNEFNPIWNETLCIPVRLPTMSDLIKFQLKDWDMIAKQMNEGHIEGTAWRGRVFVSKTARKIVEPKNGSAVWYESLKEITFAGPKDFDQLPDIFVDLRTRPKVGKGKRLGFIRLKPAELDQVGKPVWSVVQTDIFSESDSSQIVAMLQYSISFGQTSQFGPRLPLEKPLMQKYQLRVHFYQGRNLPVADSNGASDPYCVVSMGRWTAKTRVVKNTCFPLWYETVVMEVEVPQKRELASDVNINVWDWDQIGNDFLGRFSVPSRNLSAKFPDVPTWYPIFQRDPTMPEGEILASFQLIPIQDVNAYPMIAITPKFQDCILEISVVGLRELLPVHLFPVKNSFIEFNCGGEHKVKTKTSNSINPNFLEILELPIRIPTNPIFAPAINIRVYDDRKIFRPLVGQRSIPTESFVPWYHMAEEKTVDEANEPAVDPAPGSSFIYEELQQQQQPLEAVMNIQDEADEKTSLLGSNQRSEEEQLGNIPEDKKRMLLLGLNRRRTEEPAETLPEGVGLDDEIKLERQICKHELERDIIKKPTFVTVKIYRAKNNKKKKKEIFQVGEFKGQFRVVEPKRRPPPLDLVEMFRRSEMVVRVYILECFQLVPKDRDGGNNPYIKIKCGKYKLKDERSKKQKTSRPQIFKCYEIPCTFPEQTMLDVAVWDWDPLPPHELIGLTRIDLENRFHSQEWKSLDQKPMEYRTLWSPSSSNAQGQIKMWIDILTAEEARKIPPENIAPPSPMECELRVIVWDTKEVVFKDAKMSDIFVSCYPEGSKPQFTDVHWRSEDHSGEFNWRMKFPLLLPHPAPRLKVQIWDKDVTTPDDAIGEAVLNLKPFFRKFLEKKSDREILPKQYLTLTKTGTEGVQGKVQLTIEVLTKDEAKRRPAGLGRSDPNANPYLEKPKRPETSFGWWRVDRLGALVAKQFWKAHRKKFFLCCLIILIVVGIVIFLYVRPLLPSF